MSSASKHIPGVRLIIVMILTNTIMGKKAKSKSHLVSIENYIMRYEFQAHEMREQLT